MREENPTVYSTESGRICPKCGHPQDSCACKKQSARPTGDGIARVSRESKGRKGKVVTLFFGYTQCPDVCPTNLLGMVEVLRQLGPDADKVQVLFITVDPERDTQALLAQYVPAFDARFVGLYGDIPTTQAVAKDFKVFYQKQGDTKGTAYTVDHSTGT